jgi:hypothetical protein
MSKIIWILERKVHSYLEVLTYKTYLTLVQLNKEHVNVNITYEDSIV